MDADSSIFVLALDPHDVKASDARTLTTETQRAQSGTGNLCGLRASVVRFLPAPTLRPRWQTVGRRTSALLRIILRTPALYLVGLYLLVHALYWLAGVRFDMNPLTHFWQFLDPELLRGRLLESLAYLHIQPPLYNLFLGLGLKLGGAQAVWLIWACYLAAGLALYEGLYWLMRRLDVPARIALAASTLFMASPSFILYEHWLFYTFLLASLLMTAAAALALFLRNGKTGQAAVFFGLLFVLAGMRSLFQLPYFVVVAAALWLFRPQRRRQVLVAAAIPALLILALYAKNWIVFDRFSTSTWLGMNFWGMVSRDLPPAERDRLVADGVLSPVAQIERFAPVDAYDRALQTGPAPAAAPALTDERKSTGTVNYNHYAYLHISEAYLQDATAVLRHYPRAYLIGVAKGWFNYFRSSSDYVFLEFNRRHMTRVNNLYDGVLYLKLPYDLSDIPWLPLHMDPTGETGERSVYLLLLVGLPVAFVYGLWTAWRSRALSLEQRLLVLFLCFNIGYVALVGNLMEVGENNRFRFTTDAMTLVLAALLAARLGRGLRRR